MDGNSMADPFHDKDIEGCQLSLQAGNTPQPNTEHTSTGTEEGWRHAGVRMAAAKADPFLWRTHFKGLERALLSLDQGHRGALPPKAHGDSQLGRGNQVRPKGARHPALLANLERDRGGVIGVVAGAVQGDDVPRLDADLVHRAALRGVDVHIPAAVECQGDTRPRVLRRSRPALGVLQRGQVVRVQRGVRVAHVDHSNAQALDPELQLRSSLRGLAHVAQEAALRLVTLVGTLCDGVVVGEMNLGVAAFGVELWGPLRVWLQSLQGCRGLRGKLLQLPPHGHIVQSRRRGLGRGLLRGGWGCSCSCG
eukprot:RCo038966